MKPEWVTQSIKAGVLLPWSDFRLFDETPAQRKLSFSSPVGLTIPVWGTNGNNGGPSEGVMAMSAGIGDRPVAVPGSSFIKRAAGRQLSASGPPSTGKVANRPIAIPRGFGTREVVDLGQSLPQPIAKPRSPTAKWAVSQPQPRSSSRSKDITIPPSDELDFDQFPSYQLPASNTSFTSVPSYQPQRSFDERDGLMPPSRRHSSRDYSHLIGEREKQDISQGHQEAEDEDLEPVNLVFVPPTSPALPRDNTKEYNPVPVELDTFSLKFSSPPPNTFPPQKTTRARKTRTPSRPLKSEQPRLELSPTPGPPPSRPEAVAIIKGQEAYEVEAFIDERIHPKRKNRRAWTEYLVSWKGYPLDEASWEPEKQLKQDLKDGEFDRLLRKWQEVQWEESGSESGDGSGKVKISVEIPARAPGSLNVSGGRDIDKSMTEPPGSVVVVRQLAEEQKTEKLQAKNASRETTYGSTPSDFLELGKEITPLLVNTSVIARPLGDSREIRDSLSPDDIMDEDEDFGWGAEEQRIMDSEGDDLFNKMTEEPTLRDSPVVGAMAEPKKTENSKIETLPVASQSFESIYGTPVDFTEDFMEVTLGDELNVPDAPGSTMEDIISPVDFADLMHEDEKELEKPDTPVDFNTEGVKSPEMEFLTSVDLPEEREALPETRPLLVESAERSFKLSAETPIPPPEENLRFEMTAEQKMAAYLSNPGIREQTCLNPGFLQKYHEESRLHQLSTCNSSLISFDLFHLT